MPLSASLVDNKKFLCYNIITIKKRRNQYDNRRNEEGTDRWQEYRCST